MPNQDRGPGSADIPHRFAFSTVWDINYARSLSNGFLRALLNGYQISGISQVQSGQHFNVAVGGDPNNDGNFATDRVPGIGRNSLTGPWFAFVYLSNDIRSSHCATCR